MPKRRNAYNLGEKHEPGAGGGQAGEMLVGSTEPRPVDAPGPPSAAQLHEWYGPLHARDPRTKVEGLEILPWKKEMVPRGQPQFNLRMEGRPAAALISTAHAADLLVMGVVKATGWFAINHYKRKGVESFIVEIAGEEAEAPTLPEAVATAYHRMLDAEEATDVV